jgi:hypothetical protein
VNVRREKIREIPPLGRGFHVVEPCFVVYREIMRNVLRVVAKGAHVCKCIVKREIHACVQSRAGG